MNELSPEEIESLLKEKAPITLRPTEELLLTEFIDDELLRGKSLEEILEEHPFLEEFPWLFEGSEEVRQKHPEIYETSSREQRLKRLSSLGQESFKTEELLSHEKKDKDKVLLYKRLQKEDPKLFQKLMSVKDNRDWFEDMSHIYD